MRITDNEVRDCIAAVNARQVERDSRRGKPYDGTPSGRGGELQPITFIGLEKVVGQTDLGLGNPLVVNGPTPAEPEDNSGVTTQKKTPGKRPAGEKGKGPIVKGVTKSPSESVGDDVGQTSKLTENPFDNGAKPKKLSRKRGGNPGEEDGPGARQSNEFVPASLNDMPFRRFASPEVKAEGDMSPSQRALWKWSQRR